MARLGFDGHQPRVQQALVVQDGIHGAHHRVARTLVREHPHGNGFFEVGVDLLVRRAVPRVAAPAFFFVAMPQRLAFSTFLLFDVESRAFAFGAEFSGEDAVPLALFLRLVDDHVAVAPLNAFVEGPFRFASAAQIPVEGGLKFLAQVPLHRCFCSRLEAAINGGMDLDAIPVKVVLGSVCLGQHPFTLSVLRSKKFLQLRPQGLSEIRRQPFVVADFLVIQSERECLQRIHFLLRQSAVTGHLSEDHIAAVQNQFRTTQGVEKRAVLQHAHQHGRLVNLQLVDVFVEINVGRGFDAHRLVQEIVSVQVECDDFVFGVKPFEACSNDPLFRFLQEGPLQSAGAVVLLREKLFGQLLSQCRPAPALTHEGNRPGQSDEIDAAVSFKTRIFGADKGLDQVVRQLPKPSIRTVL